MRKISILSVLLVAFFYLQAQVSTPSKGRLVHYEQFKSKFVPPRNIDVWLPEDYAPDKKYAVFYLQDGQNLFDPTGTFNRQEWRVDETLDSLLVTKAIRDCIVVGIWNTRRRRTEYFPAKPFFTLPSALQDTLRSDLGDATAQPESDAYLHFLVDELKPFIDRTYPTLKGPKNTFVGGSSMGALISLYAICEYPGVFGGAACLSTHWPGTIFRQNQAIPDAFVAYLSKHLPNPVNHKFYFDFGTATLDAWYEPHQQKVDQVMKNKGYHSNHWITRKFQGDPHAEIAWQKRFWIPAVLMLGR
jgi:enterochelin esterase-like enzyme